MQASEQCSHIYGVTSIPLAIGWDNTGMAVQKREAHQRLGGQVFIGAWAHRHPTKVQTFIRKAGVLHHNLQCSHGQFQPREPGLFVRVLETILKSKFPEASQASTLQAAFLRIAVPDLLRSLFSAQSLPFNSRVCALNSPLPPFCLHQQRPDGKTFNVEQKQPSEINYHIATQWHPVRSLKPCARSIK